MSSIVVLIGGGHAAGKLTTAKLLKQEIESSMAHEPAVELIDLRSYEIKVQDNADVLNSKASAITVNKNGSSAPALKPSRFQFSKLKQYLAEQKTTPENNIQKVFIVHGLYALYDKELRDMSHMKVFIDSDADTRLIRWIRRDITNNKEPATLEYVINSYLQGARTEMSDYIFPTKEFADVIMPRGAEANAVKLIFDGILLNLEDKSLVSTERVRGNLRPTGHFDMEKFDDQKNKFYTLN
ncbi:P-loop containing nucleoside triphosphate hydrolase protein [Suhomyces tanzawaensis NRRL Y-17324]|uniref:p-loop containing nucleoside triphosphate hydrolase protein n=1 Tax=Suhomyces tanzawaensis NRRL Y-17324 TaxID=984487 RepID=A0A1E4SPH3_9ASCO|nr:P-loop containing nucleoside triphosphate hydrolase protein [Suhomyces tanzawaensis NRRL Y-17324]ODV81421.1 P-loop containing nucleoside triphosphate hydrolase protein [Suhomyces tanzawaensis NRRL Y-17324]